ncbi:MAG: DNA-binding response regulator [Euryarchaeota archaeon]|nr:DNA-binding response regulator [Euryarchaeota archaeon]
MAKILLIEDDQRIRELVCEHLASEGHSVSSEPTGMEGLQKATIDSPDLIVIDLGLPDLEGIDLLKMLRSVNDVPVLVLTAREEEDVVLAAFEGGADDYVVKPVSGPQLSARVNALLRRSDAGKNEKIVVGGLEILLGPRRASMNEVPLDLTTKEFDVLVYLASRTGTVVSKEELHSAVWKTPGGSEGRTIDVHISTLRKKLGEKADDEKGYLHTSIGAGVKLESPNG